MIHPSMLATVLALTALPQTEKQPNPPIQVGSVWDYNLGESFKVKVVKVTDTEVTISALDTTLTLNKESFLKTHTLISSPVEEKTFGFAGALTALEEGKKVARKGWNGKGIFVARYFPNDNDFINQSFLYIDSTGLQSNNPDAPKNRTAWFPSQTDMSAKDWVLV